MDKDEQRPGVVNPRREAIRKELLAVARRLFAAKGYEGTSIDDVVLASAIARGAFYIEFEDKEALFRAVVERAQHNIRAYMEEVLEAEAEDPYGALLDVASAFLEAASEKTTHRIVYVDGPDVLGWHDWRELEHRHKSACLESALRSAMKAEVIDPLPIGPLASMLGSALTDAAMMLSGEEEGAKPTDLLRVIGYMLGGLRKVYDAGECADGEAGPDPTT